MTQAEVRDRPIQIGSKVKISRPSQKSNELVIPEDWNEPTRVKGRDKSSKSKGLHKSSDVEDRDKSPHSEGRDKIIQDGLAQTKDRYQPITTKR